MKIASFQPTEYTSPCGTIRARLVVGNLWSGMLLHVEPHGHRWEHRLYGHTAEAAIGAVLEELGILDEAERDPPDEPDRYDDPLTSLGDIGRAPW